MAYTELAGRGVDPKPTATIYRTVAVCTTPNEAPIPYASVMAGGFGTPTFVHTVAPMCQGASIDEKRYPGRFHVTALWEAPLARAELIAGTRTLQT